MAKQRYLFTSESVTEGHPDKLADQISDAVLDAYLAQDPLARVACETSVTTGLVLLFGEVSAQAQVNAARVARNTIAEVGYTSTEYGLDAEHSAVLVSLDPSRWPTGFPVIWRMRGSRGSCRTCGPTARAR